MLLKEILQANKEFVKHYNSKVVCPKKPKKSLAILACMDHRLVEFLEPALGIGRGDAVIIKNAGNISKQDESDVLRSLTIALYILGCKEIAVIGHTNCGMKKLDLKELRANMLENGINYKNIENIKLNEWFGSFECEGQNVLDTVKHIREFPLVAKHIIIHGLIIDIDKGNLHHLITI